MNAIERILSTSPWWVNPEWFERDRSIRHVEDSGIRFRHLNPGLRKPEAIPKDEHRTSNIQRRTSNKEVALLLNLF